MYSLLSLVTKRVDLRMRQSPLSKEIRSPASTVKNQLDKELAAGRRPAFLDPSRAKFDGAYKEGSIG